MRFSLSTFIATALVVFADSSSAASEAGRPAGRARGASNIPKQQGERMLSKSGSKGGGVEDCCDLVQTLLELDSACEEELAAVETQTICEDTFDITPSSSKGGKGSNSISADAPFAGYAEAVAEFEAFVALFNLGGTEIAPEDDCTATLVTYGGWCDQTVVTIDDPFADPPVFTYTAPTTVDVGTIVNTPLLPAPIEWAWLH